jgi:type I restriction enzyme S subunit
MDDQVSNPENWNEKRLKYISSHIIQKRLPSEGEIKISPENVTSITGKILNYYSDYETEGQEFKSGDILFNKLRVYLNKVVLCDFDGLSMGEMIVVRPHRDIDGGYLSRLMSSQVFINKIDSLAEGVKLPRPPIEGILNEVVSVPPLDEQKLISRYLDQKTEQIDSLIEKIEKKIELLTEQRTSLINQCVTKGLDLNVEMKDSGVEWIGDIPNHWDLWSVRHLIGVSEIEVQDGNHGEIHPKSDDYVDEGIPFIMASNIVDGRVDTGSAKKIAKTQADKLRIGFSREGDVLLSHKGSIGKVALVDNIDTEYLMLTPQVTYYRTKENIVKRKFLMFSMQSVAFLEQMFLLSSDGSTRNFCGIVDQRNLVIPLPSIEEQREIELFLEPETKKLDRLIYLENQRLDKLAEYRKSLISSVVTGKVRVTEDMV